MSHCILCLAALTVSELSALSHLVAVTFLSLRSALFPATPDVSVPILQDYYYYYYYYYLLHLIFHSGAVDLILVTNKNKYT